MDRQRDEGEIQVSTDPQPEPAPYEKGSWLYYAVLGSSQLSMKDRAPELKLHAQKWFDYRFLPPWMATDVFFRKYASTWRDHFALPAERTSPRSKSSKCPTGDDTRRRLARLTTAWRARQFADSLGVPYEVFFRAAFGDLLERGPRRKPGLNQLYAPKNRDRIAEAVDRHWTECRRSRLWYSTHDAYHEDAFKSLPSQVAHHVWVLNELRSHLSPRAIGEVCFINRVLPIDTAISEFGDDQVELARLEVETADPGLTTLRSAIPSCYALPGAFSTSGSCLNCPVWKRCASRIEQVKGHLVHQYQTHDPIGLRHLNQQKRRTRRFREREARRGDEHRAAE